MAQQTTLKIAVAEESVVVRMGILATLKRLLGGEATYLEVAEPDDLETRLASFVPTVVMVSPTFGGRFDICAWRDKTDLYARCARFVALMSQVVASPLCLGYDAQISIFDTEDDIMALIDQLRGRDAEPPPTPTARPCPSAKQVVRGVVSGMANKEIADQMNISVYTVLTHRRNIARKLNIHSSIALAIYAISNKLVAVDEVK